MQTILSNVSKAGNKITVKFLRDVGVYKTGEVKTFPVKAKVNEFPVIVLDDNNLLSLGVAINRRFVEAI